jgi:hypothetical protein
MFYEEMHAKVVAITSVKAFHCGFFSVGRAGRAGLSVVSHRVIVLCQ